MSTQNIGVIFNISGNAEGVVNNITAHTNELNAVLNKTTNIFNGLGGKIVVLEQLSQMVESVKSGIDSFYSSGINLNTSLMDLSAITGETGDGLKKIEGYARESAKTFGTSAAEAVESYKLILSQLSPELTKTPDALRAMGDNIIQLSKTMGGNTTAAAEVLTNIAGIGFEISA